MKYSKEKREIEDNCNICGKIATLTWDHVPPKGCDNYNKLKCSSFSNIKEEDYMLSQNGVKFRSICSFCNNTLLGTYYDPYLIEFSNIISDYILAAKTINNYHCDGIQINKICRSVIGHLLASRNHYENDNLTDKYFRKYFLNQGLPPSNKYSLYLKIYPFSTILVYRDMVVNVLNKETNNLPKGLISGLYYFPFSFVFAERGSQTSMIDLFRLCTSNINEEISFDIDINSHINNVTNSPYFYKWPLNVQDELGGTQMLLSYDKALKSSVLAKRL